MKKKELSRYSRVVVFAAHDNNGIIKQYVFTYLNRLKEISDYIVLISDCNYSDIYKERLSGFVDHFDCSIHHEYDFGSYKRGINYLVQNNILDKYDEIVLCNDSCLCLTSLDKVFLTMESKHVDFWSIVLCKKDYEHLQSYFLVFKKKVFTSSCFLNYFLSVKEEKRKGDIVKSYEHPLKKYFEAEGYSSGYFITDDNTRNPFYFPLSLIKNGCCLIKKKIFLDVFFSKESVLLLLILIKKYYKDNITDILDLCNEKSFSLFFLKTLYKKYIFSSFNISNGIKGFCLFSFLFFYRNKNSYIQKKPSFLLSIKNFFHNIKKFKISYFKTKLTDDYFFNIERVYLSKDIEAGKKIALYGFGPYGKDFIANCLSYYHIDNIYDRNYLSMAAYVRSPECITEKDFDFIIVSVMDPKARNSVLKFLSDKKIHETKIAYIDYF